VVRLAVELYRATSVAKTASGMAWRYASEEISHYGLRFYKSDTFDDNVGNFNPPGGFLLNYIFYL
jgi:hypothetical protein